MQFKPLLFKSQLYSSLYFCVFWKLPQKVKKEKKTPFFTVIWKLVRQLKVWETDEYRNVCSGSWVLTTEPHSRQPPLPKISFSRGNGDAGDRTATLACAQQCSCGWPMCLLSGRQPDDVDRAYPPQDYISCIRKTDSNNFYFRIMFLALT